ncbi:MAG: DUF3060 domain-containing protein [Mycobacterium sp.]
MNRARTHPPAVVLGVAVGILAVVVGAAGCGGSNNGASKPSRSKSFEAQMEFGHTINYGSFGTTAEVDCVDGKSLNVGGSNNTLRVRGTCESVHVIGADNRITVERVNKSLLITGFGNTVTFRAGEPKVDDNGSGNTVNKR